MRKRIILLSVFVSILSATESQANVCGTDYQTFNPTTSGLDFITVHSSETLKPCVINFGSFINYSVNTLTYSRSFTDGNGNNFQAGNKPNDQITGIDFGLGTGLTENWDIGINIPVVMSQNIENSTLNLNYEATGVTEVKVNSKYRLSGNDKGGTALIASINQNLIEGNPFSGQESKPTLNLELAMDSTWGLWALAFNIGHRWRNPGERIPNVPFEPLGNQVIYSGAASYYFKSLDSKLIFELFGGKFTGESNSASQRSPDSFEWQVGMKHDLSHNIALHFGGGSQLANSLGSPEYRVYAGLNWAFLTCEDDLKKISKPIRKQKKKKRRRAKLERVRYNAVVLFDFDSANVRNGDVPDLNLYFDKIKRKHIKKITIEGYTDSLGSLEYNKNLSLRRANSIKDYLLRRYKGLRSKKIETIGFGPENPVASNGNFQGRQKNRRVEFIIEYLAVKDLPNM